MKRALASVLVAAFAVACRDHSPLEVPGGPSAAISDGAHSAGNPDFFFLPPIARNPSGDPNFEPAEFNASLSPTVEVCSWSGTACGAVVAQFTMSTGLGSETVRVSLTDQHYMVNWHTDLSNLDPALTYRIRVLVGSQELGFADVDVVSGGGQLKNVNTLEYIGLVDGRTLPIKFRIENAALCDPPGGDCSSELVNLADDVPDEVTLPTGDGVTIPPQNAGGQNVTVTITVQECEDDIDVDLPTFGRCLTITADPPLDGELDPPAVVSVCNVDFDVHAAGVDPEQERLITMHRQSGETIQALPHADDFCPPPGPIGSLGAKNGLRGFARAAWDLIGRSFAVALAPSQLHASLVVLDVGGGGETPDFSDFQFALPAQMDPMAGTDGQTADPGAAVEIPPGVVVTDRDGAPVAGATVHFEVVAGNGTITPVEVVSNADGTAQLTSWELGETAGLNTVRAFGRGIADPGDEGPFMPPIPTDFLPEPPPELDPVLVGTGEVFFNAEAVVAQLVSPVSSSLQMVASSNANGIVVEDTDGGSQTGTLNPLSAEVSARAVSEGTDILTSGSATATWTDAGNGQVVFTGVGWAIAQNTGLNSHAHLTAGNDWTYTFVAVQSGTFTLQFNVTQDAGTTNNFGLNGFNFRWTPSGGSSQLQFMSLGTTGTITKTVVAGTTYTVQVDNQANVFFSGGFGTPTAHMSGMFNWSIAAPIL